MAGGILYERSSLDRAVQEIGRFHAREKLCDSPLHAFKGRLGVFDMAGLIRLAKVVPLRIEGARITFSQPGKLRVGYPK